MERNPCQNMLHLNSTATDRWPGLGGIDHNPIIPNRASKSISAEDTFEQDIPLADTEPVIRKLAEKVWTISGQNARLARTVTLKLKPNNSILLHVVLPPPLMPVSADEFVSLAVLLCSRVDLDSSQLFRLVGIGLSNFQVDTELDSPLSNNESI
jgi:DNA polymerase IV